MNIAAFAERIPAALGPRSGKAFYSGRRAFSAPARLYVLGLNPGGDPESHSAETVESHTRDVLNSRPDDWSAYRDESWKGAAPGTYGMAPRVLHLFACLDLRPGEVPCSNLIFVRSSRERDIEDEFESLAQACWPFHEFVVEQLQPRAILCFGGRAGNYVREKLNADELVGEFVEDNNRRWRSRSFIGRNGVKVVVATHPSIADWTRRETDPTPLVRQTLR